MTPISHQQESSSSEGIVNDSSSSTTTYFSSHSFIKKNSMVNNKHQEDGSNVWATVNINDYSVIQCQDMDDYMTLLYNVCINSGLCSELYYLTQDFASSNSSATFHDAKNLKKFKYQILTTSFFILSHGQNLPIFENTSIMNVSSQQPFILQETWPISWFPPFVFQIHESNETSSIQSCQTLPLIHAENRTFVIYTLYLLQTYKSFMANNYCSNHNERLMLDKNNQFHCECMEGKDCNNESNFRLGTISLQIAELIAEVILIVLILFSSNSILEKLSLVRNKHKFE